MKVTGKRNRQNRHQGSRMMVHTRWHGTYSAPSDLFLSDGMLSGILQSSRWHISCLLHKALQERNNPKRNSSRRSPAAADQVTNLAFRLKGKPAAEADFSKPYRKLERKIAREQRRLSRMVYGSNNWIRQKQYVAKLHAKAKHQREDMLHKLSCMLTDRYDRIFQSIYNTIAA